MSEIEALQTENARLKAEVERLKALNEREKQSTFYYAGDAARSADECVELQASKTDLLRIIEAYEQHGRRCDQQEIERLKVDNAALVEALQKAVKYVGTFGRPEFDAILAQPHPGQALLEKLKVAEGALERTEEWLVYFQGKKILLPSDRVTYGGEMTRNAQTLTDFIGETRQALAKMKEVE